MRKYLVFRNEEFLINDLQDHSRKAPAGELESSAHRGACRARGAPQRGISNSRRPPGAFTR